MELLREYWKALMDPTVPSHRILRKATAITALLAVSLAIYRHGRLGFGFGEPLVVTLGLIFILWFVVGLLGAVLAASFYDFFLRAVGAQNTKLTISVFFAEWLFAFTSPLLGLLAYGFTQFASQQPI